MAISKSKLDIFCSAKIFEFGTLQPTELLGDSTSNENLPHKKQEATERAEKNQACLLFHDGLRTQV